MKKIAYAILFLMVVLLGCNGSDDTDDTNLPIEPTLLFSSGFEANTYIDDLKDDYEIIKGTDAITGYSWPIRILGSDFAGIHRINDDSGFAVDNYLEKVIGPYGTETTALFQRVNYDVNITQTPYQINNIKENPRELYIRYWMKIDLNSVIGSEKWRAIWEYKTKRYNFGTSEGFRMIAFIATNSNGDPYWLLQGDRNPTLPVWQVRNTLLPIPRDEWFLVEYYIKWGQDENGYASMKVNGNLVGEHYGATTYNNDDLDFIILTQVYGNTDPMHQWVDDIEIWNTLPDQ